MAQLLGLFGGYLFSEFSSDWSHEEFSSDWSHEAVIKVAACESPVDLPTSGATRNYNTKDFSPHDVTTHNIVNKGHSEMIKAGARQSPVNLLTSEAVHDGNLKAFSLHDVTQVANNGHSVRVMYTLPFVSGGALDGEHEVLEYHFHWGSNNTRGSEHTVDGKSYPMEMHVVTFNKRYGDCAKAEKYDGLAVLGIFFEISPDDNSNLEPLVNTLRNVTDPGEKCAMPPVPLKNLLPRDLTQYYSYPGSLTTQPYRENVMWTVFKQPIPISTRQMEAFRALRSGEADVNGKMKPLCDNYRQVQTLGYRTIRKSF